MIKDLYKLKYIIRYSNYARVTNEDVAQHSFYVSCIVIELHQRYKETDLGKMLLMSTVHDWPESIIDDVSHAVKRDYPAVAKALKVAERKVVKNYPLEVQDAFNEFEDQKTLESKIVKLADTIQCIQYLENEHTLGNSSLMQLLLESMELKNKLKVF